MSNCKQKRSLARHFLGEHPPQKDSGPLGITPPQRAIESTHQDSSSRHPRPLRVIRRGIPFNRARRYL
jgi:hypothetical protein